MDLQDLANKYSGFFVVNYENFDVIYSEGYENKNGLWCYKISDLNKLPEQNNVSDETQDSTNSGDNQVQDSNDNGTNETQGTEEEQKTTEAVETSNENAIQ